MTLSNALAISRKTATVNALLKNADWIRLVKTTKLPAHEQEFLNPDWKSGSRNHVSTAHWNLQ